ncbi:CAX-interacting protein 4 [Hibiscus syriacus]|uniref:CAX-interacting protein 4 n=1 Tax=Hibiscus syriacus TaxID=106335 RepID=A0A6A2Z9D5_HIBSY|nr:CAX-interacting protein 4-like [Hibiscus syriacus]KAE8688508.1 CAX-interacting protein 4 [Hibiscus syriacus]
MPATAGRVRMPANNRVHSSAALQTHGIWQSAIGYDPYAPNKDDSKNQSTQMTAAAEPDGENAYASFQGLLALARITGSNADEARGACKKCGRVGHLTFQCKNLVSLKESKEKDPEAIQAAVLNGLDKLKGGKVKEKKEVESEDDDEESEDSDSDVDSEIERIIAQRSGQKVTRKGRKSSKKKKDSDADDSSDSDHGERKKRGRSKKRSSRKRGISESNDEDEGRRKRRKEKRKKRNESSDEEDDHRRHRKRKSRKEKRRRRSHRHSDDSESSDVSDGSGKRHRRNSHRHESPFDSDVSGSDDSRVGRRVKRSGSPIMKTMSRGLSTKGFKRVGIMFVQKLLISWWTRFYKLSVIVCDTSNM